MSLLKTSPIILNNQNSKKNLVAKAGSTKNQDSSQDKSKKYLTVTTQTSNSWYFLLFSLNSIPVVKTSRHGAP
jgi:hypothetical protein